MEEKSNRTSKKRTVKRNKEQISDFKKEAEIRREQIVSQGKFSFDFTKEDEEGWESEEEIFSDDSDKTKEMKTKHNDEIRIKANKRMQMNNDN